MTKILQAEWRSGINTVGIVLCELDIGKQRAYIGAVRNEHFDSKEEEDALRISQHGAKLAYREAVGFFPNIKEEDYV